MNYKKLIEETYSVRDYSEKPIGENLKNEIISYFPNSKNLLDNVKTEIKILDNSEVYDALNGKAGYNGIMINAPHYIIIYSEKADNYIENSGYKASDIILKATDLGLNTCFITMSDREEISKILNIPEGMEITALIALGYKEKDLKNVSNDTKAGGNYSKANVNIAENAPSYRKDLEELVFSESFGNSATLDELINIGIFEPLRTVLFAPSALNSQPWRFILKSGKVFIAVEDTLHTSSYDEKISLGALMHYFQSVFETDFFGLKWTFDVSNAPEVPSNFKVEVSCTM